MSTVKQEILKPDVESILTLEDKRNILKEMDQEDLLEIFKKGYEPKYIPAVPKAAPLDQQVSFSVSKSERDFLKKEMLEIKKLGPGISISAYVRNKVVSEIDLKGWAEQSYKELKKLNNPENSRAYLEKEVRNHMKLVEDAETDEDYIIYQKELEDIEKQLKLLKKQSFKRRYRLSGRVTFDEVEDIKWRAARLNLTLADYLRYLTFNYHPGSDADLNLSLESRKRFYVSVLDVYKNGWGNPPKKEQCPNCAKYQKKIKELEKEIEKYKKYLGR